MEPSRGWSQVNFLGSLGGIKMRGNFQVRYGKAVVLPVFAVLVGVVLPPIAMAGHERG